MRIFKYLIGGKWVTYEDADDVYSPDDIRAHWAATYPELSAATWDKTAGPNGEEVYTFAKKVGVKGGDWPAWISTAERLPECEVGVLFCVQFEAEQFMCFGCMDRIDRDESDDCKWFSDLGDEFKPEDVTHWMAMPPFPPALPKGLGCAVQAAHS